MPTYVEKIQFAKTMMEYNKIEELYEDLPNISKMDSYSEVKDAVLLLARNFVLSKIEQAL